MQNSLTGQEAEAKVGPVSQGMAAILTGALTLAALLFGIIAFSVFYNAVNGGDDDDHHSGHHEQKLTCCFKLSFSGLIFLIMMITTFVLLLPSTGLLKIGKPSQAMIVVVLNALAAVMCLVLVVMLIYNMAKTSEEDAVKAVMKGDPARMTLGMKHKFCTDNQKVCDKSDEC
eukprot:COSAG01_NODE_18382_length_1079_cov_1.798980_1_plen_171_part_10